MYRQLMQGSADAVEAAADSPMDPVKALRAGHGTVQSVPGSCTACVAIMHPDGELQVCVGITACCCCCCFMSIARLCIQTISMRGQGKAVRALPCLPLLLVKQGGACLPRGWNKQLLLVVSLGLGAMR